MKLTFDVPIDLTEVRDRGSFKKALGFTRNSKPKAKMIGLNVLDFRRGESLLTDKELLVLIGIGMECCYRNIVYTNREEVQKFANIQKSTYWRAYTKLNKLGVIFDSGLTQTDRKCKILFIHPDYFYCGSERMRSIDLNRWAMGDKTIGLEEFNK